MTHPAAPLLEGVVHLEPTKSGFRCWYAFYESALVVQVLERVVQFDDATRKHVALWCARANVGVMFGASRAQARRIVEQLTGLFDEELRRTLGPLWATWDGFAAEQAPVPMQAPTLRKLEVH